MREILERLWSHEIDVEEAMKELKHFPYLKLKDAKIDIHRATFRNIPEAIYAEGKTKDEVREIAEAMMEHGRVFITRAEKELYEYIKDIGELRYYEDAKMIVSGKRERKNGGYIAVVSAGISDRRVAEEAAVTVYEMGNEVERIYDVGIASISRLLDFVDILENANVVIVVAGMEGALPTMVSNFVSSPVIAVPTSVGYGTGLGGVAALMGMLNSCSPGIVVVNIDNGFGAGIAAHLMNMRKQL